MHAIIFADRKPLGSDPIGQQSCPALLTLGGRPVLVHTIEDLAGAGFTRVSLVISSQAYRIEKLIGNGSRWGIEIEYLLSRGEEKPSTLIKRYSNRMRSATMLVRGDMMRSPCINDVLKNVSANTVETCVYFDTQPAGIVFTRDVLHCQMIDTLDWLQLQGEASDISSILQLGGYHRSLLDNHAKYFETALAVTAGEFINIKLRGLKTDSGLVHGRNLHLDGEVDIDGHLLVGDNVRIESGVQVNGTVVIGNDVLIDQGARLRNCLVLDETYVGKGVNLENCVLSGNHIFRVDMGAGIAITDEYLVADLVPASTPILDRLLATMLLMLSLPLWLYAAILTLVQSPRQVFNRVRIHTNRTQNHAASATVETWKWNLTSPLLQKLPWLLNIIRGDIRLIGTTPEVQRSARDVELSYLAMPSYGLLSVNQIDLGDNVTELEKNLNEYLYERQRSTWSDIRYLVAFVRQLFQPGSWREIDTVKI